MRACLTFLAALIFLTAPAGAESPRERYEEQAMSLNEFPLLLDGIFFFGGVGIKGLMGPKIRQDGHSIRYNDALGTLSLLDQGDLIPRIQSKRRLSLAAGITNLAGMGILLGAFGYGQCCGVRETSPLLSLAAYSAVVLLPVSVVLELVSHQGLMRIFTEHRRRLRQDLDPRWAQVPVSAWSPLWRSALVPGWGQLYSGHKVKAYVLAGTGLTLAFYLTRVDLSTREHQNYETMLGALYGISVLDAALNPIEGLPYGRQPDWWVSPGQKGGLQAGLSWHY